MSEFWLVASIGHCATKWLTAVLDDQPDIAAHHELKRITAGMRWYQTLKYEQRNGPASAQYRDYWSQIDKDLADNQVVVDVNSWLPTAVFEMMEDSTALIAIDRVIYVTRNGISQLHSMWNHSNAWRKEPLDSYHLNGYIKKLTGLEPDGLTRWERLCNVWDYSIRIGRYLTERYDHVQIIPFERLTQSPKGLKDILPSMGLIETMKWRKQDINRKVQGPRRPNDIWTRWTPEMRETFTRACGESMARAGYKMPE